MNYSCLFPKRSSVVLNNLRFNKVQKQSSVIQFLTFTSLYGHRFILTRLQLIPCENLTLLLTSMFLQRLSPMLIFNPLHWTINAYRKYEWIIISSKFYTGSHPTGTFNRTCTITLGGSRVPLAFSPRKIISPFLKQDIFCNSNIRTILPYNVINIY